MKLEFSYSKLTLALALACGLSSAIAGTPNPVYLDEVTKFLPQFQQNADHLWPGLSSINNMPIIVAADDSLYAFHYQPKNPMDWQAVTKNNQQVYYKDHGGVDFFLNTIADYRWFKGPVSFEGQSVIMANASENPAQAELELNNAQLASFYYLQYELAYSPYAASKRAQLWQHDTGYNAFNQKDLLALLMLQKELMQDYLSTKNIDTLKNYVAVFLTRYSMLDENAKTREVKVFDAINPWYIAMQAVSSDSKAAQAKLLSELKTRPVFNPAEPDWTLYGTQNALFELSAAVEFALDDLQLNWKPVVEEKSIAPTLYLADYFHMSPAEVSSRFATSMQQKNFNEIAKKVDVLDPYLQTVKQHWQAYQKDSGVELVFDVKPQGEDAFLKLNNVDGYKINAFTTVYVNKQDSSESDVPAYQIVHNYYLFSANHFGRLVEYDQNEFVKDGELDKVAIKFPLESKVSIDDAKAMTLAQLLASDKVWTFTKLSVTHGDKVVTLTGIPYHITVLQGKVVISPATPKLGLSKSSHGAKNTVLKLLHKFK